MKTFFLLIFLSCSPSILSAQIVDSATTKLYHQQLFEHIDRINVGDVNSFIASFDIERFTERVFDDITVASNNLEQFKNGFKRGMKSEMHKALNEMLTAFDNYQYVNFSVTDSSFSMLMRGFDDEGLNYYELIIDYSNKNSLRIIDIYPYYSGELFSDTINRIVIILLSETGMLDTTVSGFDTNKQLLSSNVDKMKQMGEMRRQANHQGMVNLYKSLPEPLKVEKIFIINVLTSAFYVDEMFYLSIIEQYKNIFPDDPSLPLITLDYYLLRGDIENSYKMINELDATIGGDNFLNTYRGFVAEVNEDTTRAIKYYTTAISNDPYIEDAYWSLIEIYLDQENFKLVTEQLIALEEYIGYEFTEQGFEEIDIYAQYIQSSEFKEWIKP
ncbi:tetratricopeptide repeat protein [Balneola vulgaris]|uniref:tetratricopeptide repeat protein n=1 Tax=Balneola vulgaris TaxID=287535 RepID=UPI0003602EB8|nr:hypothetical protein [Balneola vulgaris]